MFGAIKSRGQNIGRTIPNIRPLRPRPNGGRTRGSAATTPRRAEIAEAIERLRALRRTFNNAPLEEILASRHEGHKY
jgi:hypothetical protein